MTRFKDIIFLDEENTALSVVAQAMLMRALDAARVFGIRILSRGNVVLFPEPVNPKVKELAGADGLNISGHVAKQMKNEDFSDDTLVLALDTDSKLKAYSMYLNAANVYTLREYTGEQGDIKFLMGKEINEYSETYALLKRTIDNLVKKLVEE